MKRIILLSIISTLVFVSCTKKEEKKVETEPVVQQETVIEATETEDAPVIAESEDEVLLDDAEEGCYWNAVQDSWAEWGNKHLVTEFSMTADVTEEWSSEGSSSILFEYEAMPEGEGISAHFYCTDLIETDWSDFTKLTATVNNTSSKAILLQFYTKSGDNWAWSDTEALTIEPGMKDIVFDFSEKGVSNKSKILEMGFVIYEGYEKASLMIDNIMLKK